MPQPFEDVLNAYGFSEKETDLETLAQALQHAYANNPVPPLEALTAYLEAVARTACRAKKNSLPEETLLARIPHIKILLEESKRAPAYLQEVFLAPPLELLRFLETFSPEHGLVPPYRQTLDVHVGPADAAEQIFFRYPIPGETKSELDQYLNQHMPINGDVSFCCYDTYLPIHRLVHTYFPQMGIRLHSSPTGPYVYVLSFQYFRAYVENTQEAGLDFIAPDIWQDIRTNRALLILNDTFEAADYEAIFPLYRSILRKRGIEKNVFLLSGNPANVGVYTLFAQKLNHGPWRWLKEKLSSTQQSLPFSFFGFRFFEEAVAQTKHSFFAEYSLATRRNMLQQNQAELRPFLCFNRIVKDYRVVASYLFFKNGLVNRAYISQDYFVNETDFRFGHNKNKALFSLTEPVLFEQFRQSLPWYADTANFTPNLWNVLPMEIINKSFLWVVTETEFGKGEKAIFFLSEKTYKPMAVFMPFVLIGNPFTLQALQNEGYRTFSRWWDESYDQETDPVRRMEKIFAVLTQLGRLDTAAWFSLLDDMQETLQHNHDRLMASTAGKETAEAIVSAYRTLSA